MKVPGQNKYLCVTSIENGQKVAKYIIAQKFAVSEMIDFEFLFLSIITSIIICFLKIR